MVMVPEYPKINTIWKRDERGIVIPGEFSCEEFEYLRSSPWIFTEKVNGTNIRVVWRGLIKSVSFYGRTNRADIPSHLMEYLKETFDTEETKETLARRFEANKAEDVILFGEGYGPKIQGGEKYSSTPKFVLFDILIGMWWLRRDAILETALDLGIEYAPLRMSTPSDLDTAWAYILMRPPSFWGSFTMEGLVGTPRTQLFNRKGERIITKMKVKDYQDLLTKGHLEG